jgi:hypothetical protein
LINIIVTGELSDNVPGHYHEVVTIFDPTCPTNEAGKTKGQNYYTLFVVQSVDLCQRAFVTIYALHVRSDPASADTVGIPKDTPQHGRSLEMTPTLSSEYLLYALLYC